MRNHKEINKTDTSPILDACCGGKMFYFDKNDDRVLFQDIRSFETTLCDGRTFEVDPDIQADFTNMPYEDEHFSMVVFDPPICCETSAIQNLLTYMAVLMIKQHQKGISISNMVHCIQIGAICCPRVSMNVSEF